VPLSSSKLAVAPSKLRMAPAACSGVTPLTTVDSLDRRRTREACGLINLPALIGRASFHARGRARVYEAQPCSRTAHDVVPDRVQGSPKVSRAALGRELSAEFPGVSLHG
jgi:hypothetical protein